MDSCFAFWPLIVLVWECVDKIDVASSPSSYNVFDEKMKLLTSAAEFSSSNPQTLRRATEGIPDVYENSRTQMAGAGNVYGPAIPGRYPVLHENSLYSPAVEPSNQVSAEQWANNGIGTTAHGYDPFPPRDPPDSYDSRDLGGYHAPFDHASELPPFPLFPEPNTDRSQNGSSLNIDDTFRLQAPRRGRNALGKGAPSREQSNAQVLPSSPLQMLSPSKDINLPLLSQLPPQPENDAMLSPNHDLRRRLAGDNQYVTNLEVQRLERSEGFLGANEQNGPWVSDDPTEEQLREMQAVLESFEQ